MNAADVDMPITIAGLKLRNPFIVGSGPTTKTVEQLVEADRCGWAAAAIKLTIVPPPYINREPRYRWFDKQHLHMFTADRRLNLEEALRLVEADFSDVDLRDVRLRDVDLPDADFPDVDLPDVDLRAAGLRGRFLRCAPDSSPDGSCSLISTTYRPGPKTENETLHKPKLRMTFPRTHGCTLILPDKRERISRKHIITAGPPTVRAGHDPLVKLVTQPFQP